MANIAEGVVQLLGIGLQVSGASSLTAESNLTSAVRIVSIGSSSLTAESNMSAAARLVASAGVSLTAEADLSSSFVILNTAGSNLTAESNLGATCILLNISSCVMSGESNVSSAATLTAFCGSVLFFESNLTAEAIVISAPVVLTAQFNLIAESTVVNIASSVLSFESSVTSSCRLAVPVYSNMSAQIDLTVGSRIILAAAALTNGGSDLVADATNIRLTSCQMLCEIGMAALCRIVSIPSVEQMSSESNFFANAFVTNRASSVLSFESSLLSNPNLEANVSALMSASFDLTVSTNIIALAIALANGGSELTADAINVILGYATLEAASDLEAKSGLVYSLAPRTLSGDVNLSASLYEPLNVLYLPTVEYSYTDDRLLRRFPITSGKSLLIRDGVGTLQDFVSQTETLNADYYFTGGHKYSLNATEVAAVQDAGFGDLITIKGL